jgi:hypothetical protein
LIAFCLYNNASPTVRPFSFAWHGILSDYSMAQLLKAVKSIGNEILEVTNPVAIRKELIKAKSYGRRIGLFCLNIHSSLLYGTVDSLELSDSEQIVVFNWYNEASHERCQSHIFLTEIDAIQISKAK